MEDIHQPETTMFDQPMQSSSDEEDKQNNDDNMTGPKVARPTTKPTDRHRNREKESYNFWTEKDKEKLSTFP
jgi:hypothetical protein